MPGIAATSGGDGVQRENGCFCCVGGGMGV